MNLGYIENSLDGGDVRIRVYYDKTFEPVGDLQPLIDNPDAPPASAYCLEIVNTSGRKAAVYVTRPNGVQVRVNIPKGRASDGLVTGICQKASALALLGLLTRGDVANFTISDQDNAAAARA